MITHDEISKCIWKCDYVFTCKGKKDCKPSDKNCADCAEELLTEYENKIRSELIDKAMNNIDDMAISDGVKLAILNELSKLKEG